MITKNALRTQFLAGRLAGRGGNLGKKFKGDTFDSSDLRGVNHREPFVFGDAVTEFPNSNGTNLLFNIFTKIVVGFPSFYNFSEIIHAMKLLCVIPKINNKNTHSVF